MRRRMCAPASTASAAASGARDRVVAAVTSANPITARETAALFAGLDRPLALAVSGGVDSMALLHLIAVWRGQGGGIVHPPPIVFTVDHGLRAEAAGEAAFVASVARALGFAHRTLAWTGAKPDAGIQDAARRARYELLLGELAREPVCRDLVLAHTRDDQAETLLMRLARGSGLDGLSAMRPVECRVVVRLGHPVHEVVIRLCRPLLGVPKQRLVATAQAQGLKWCDDPSNVDQRFERVRLRREEPARAALGLTAEALARTASRLALERAAALARVSSLAAAHVSDHGGAYGEFVVPAETTLNPADAGRILARLLDVYGGAALAAQLSQIETLVERALDIRATAVGRLTLGGCIIDITGGAGAARRLFVFRECGRAPPETIVLQPGQGHFWDQRFYVSLAPDAQAAVTIGPTGSAAPAGPLPRACYAGLPALLTPDGPRLLFGQAVLPLVCQWPPQHVAKLRFIAGNSMALATKSP